MNRVVRTGGITATLSAIFGFLFLISDPAYGVPVTGTQEVSEGVYGPVEPFGVIDDVQPLDPTNAVQDAKIAQTGVPVETVNHRKTQTDSTSGGDDIAKETLPVSVAMIHETSAGNSIDEQQETHVSDDTAKVTPVQSTNPDPLAGISGYPHVPSDFVPIQVGPIVEGVNSSEPVLLPLITEAVQTISVLPLNQAFHGGQFLRPVVVPPENEFGQIVIKAIEPIEGRTPQQLEPTAYESFRIVPETGLAGSQLKPSEGMHPTTLGFVDGQSNFFTSAVPGQPVDPSQKAVGTSGQEMVRGIEKWGPYLEVGHHSPVEKVDFVHGPGDLYHQVDFIGDDGLFVNPIHYSVEETTGKSVDKICLILKKTPT